ncbi:MAG: helix-turn-helix transcriptional regulator [Actinomycetota bacterium]
MSAVSTLESPNPGSETSFRDVGWAPQGDAHRFELLERRALFERLEPAFLAQPERLDFHMVIVVHDGAGRHEVDGEAVDLEPGVVVHIQPGQITEWSPDPTIGAWLLLAPAMVAASTANPIGPRVRRLSPAAMVRCRTLVGLAVEIDDGPDRVRVERALLDLLVVTLGLTTPDPLPTGPAAPVYAAFRADLEAHLDIRESINDRAARLGYSARTLTRAAQSVAGHSAKHDADLRLALEARRLLAVPDLTVTAIARRLGFSEPTNFAKFVRRVTGRPPAAWRRR